MKYIEKHPIIMIVVGLLGISVSAVLVRFSQAPSAVTALWRLMWTIIMMTPVVLGKSTVRKKLFSTPKKTAAMSVLSGLFLAIHFVLWFESLNHTSVASSATIVCTEVIWVSLGFLLFLKGKLKGKAVAAIFVALVGSVVIALSDSGEGGSHLYGDLLALAAAIASAAYTLLGRKIRSDTDTSIYTYLCYGGCTVILLLFCLVQRLEIFGYGINAVMIGFLLALFSTILGHSVFSWCLKYFSPSFVSASKLCEPVFASIMAVFLFGEIPVMLQLAGGALILGGVFYYSRIETA